ncbi:c-type cytochrome [Hymenobacter nivis]|uniref:Cystathionine gamma-synthase n=1 Tax=Hymenobacter nivis TaxID=1850093 RepID=A0A502HEQ3_9BACT|nr:c-type cytochrome [Hymenobacter nivis]TPG71916.1 cystathionine gamma-synthase [Hymenobacter nivis]
MAPPPDPASRLQPEDKQVFVKVAGLLTWLTGLLMLVVAVTAYLLVFPPRPAAPLAATATAPAPAKSQSANFFAPARFLLDSVAHNPEGELIRYGHALIAHTPQYLGPRAKAPLLRLAGSNLACQNCHLQAGQKAFSAPYVGIWGIYPTYKGRENAISTLEERINGCMARSLNGRPLPLAGREMKAIITYMKWLGRQVPVGEKVQGQGFVKFTMPNRAADLGQGKIVFAQQCASCHGAGGQGQRVGADAQYQYPPLWGPDSYNDGAGMHRLQTAARFIKANMPFGATAEHTVLSDAAAYDVAAYINSMPRPHMAHLDHDYPDLRKKPVDCPYPPYADQFTQHQHQVGPYAAMNQGKKGAE